MNKDRRIVPFSTVILTNSKNFNSFVLQAREWSRSDSFNPHGKVFVIDCVSNKIIFIKKSQEKRIVRSKEFNSFTIFLFLFKEKPSLTIDFCNTSLSKILMMLSRSGRTCSQFEFLSFFLYGTTFKGCNSDSLESAAPFLFNRSEDVESSPRTTFFNKKFKKLPRSVLANDLKEDLVIDLGQLPKEPEGKILWVPRRTTNREAWNDFIFLTYFAETINCTIDVYFNNEANEKKISSVFFIKGRKMDFDRYVNVVEIEDLSEYFLKNKTVKGVVFSFGWTLEYKSFYTTLNRIEKDDIFLTTTTRLKRGLK
ncbi:MAG TPA: hypothetical protein PKG52_00470 [bacterium]|nr:hypothetical protein [bacterium]HPS29012.1 hypothetical protein [bacterium]